MALPAPFRPKPILALALCLALLAGCDTAEERAEGHYQSALALLEEQDVPRALVELRNVFRLNPQHLEARALYARSVLEMGEISEAYGQFLRLVEQDPDNVEGLRTLTELALRSGNWTEAERHGTRLIAAAPEMPAALAADIALRYRAAVRDEDDGRRRALAQEAQALADKLPDSPILATIRADSAMLDNALGTALEVLEAAIASHPDDPSFYGMMLTAHARLEDAEGMEQTLRAAIARFPENEELPRRLIALYGGLGDLEGAEGFLRERIEAAATAPERNDARATLIRFLEETRGPEAAQAQAAAFIDAGENPDLFRSLRATMRFRLGQRDAAIAEMEEILAGAEESEQTRSFKVALAQMLAASGNEVGARALVEEVLNVDQGKVEALRMRAEWLIRDDDADGAIIELRKALNQEPGSVPVMMTMADAHMRNGDRDLAAEVLSLAVEASEAAPGPSLAYARMLSAEDRLAPAGDVLLDALRRQPQDVRLLAALGRTYLAQEDWARAEQIRTRLQALSSQAARLAATELQVNLLRARNQLDDALAVLQDLAAGDGAAYGSADVALVQSLLERREPDAALAHIASLRQNAPEDPGLRLLEGVVHGTAGDLQAAETAFRGLIAEGAGGQRPWLELIRVLVATGRQGEIEPTLDAALDAVPEGPDLLWAKATLVERRGAHGEAIGLYERLYALDGSSLIVANNLASLLTTARQDPESLARAYRIARRLRDSDVPAFQDTYGWIAFRRGDVDIALSHLRPAARGLPDDPLVQYHLGRVYEALDRPEDARVQYARALELAGDDPRPAFGIARERMANLQASASEDGGSLPEGNGSDIQE